jgi:hypothetical protein
MYTYPYLLITLDNVRNVAIANLLEEESNREMEYKKQMYENLSDTTVIKELYRLIDINNVMNKMLIDVLQSHITIFFISSYTSSSSLSMSEMDVWRVKERLKRLLTLMRKRCEDLYHNLDNDTFFEKSGVPGQSFANIVKDVDEWEGAVNIPGSLPNVWNTIFLKRLSDIHKHMYILTNSLETYILHNRQMSTLTSMITTDYTNLIDNLDKTVDACRVIHGEVKNYLGDIPSP